MRCDARQYARLNRHGPATAVSVRPTGTAVEQYQVSLGNRHSLKEAGVIGLPSWSEKATQNETWTKVPRLSATCPRRVVAYDGGRGSIDRCMEFGDDFSRDLSKWVASGTGSATLSGGTLVMSGAKQIQSIETSFGVGHISRFRLMANPSSGYIQTGFDYPGFCAVDIYGGSNCKLYTIDGGEELNSANAGVDANYHIYEIARRAASVTMTKDGGSTQTNSTRVPQHVEGVGAYVWGGSVATFDWFFVRKYTANEPLVGTAQPTATNRALCRPLSASRAMQLAVAG